jgi:hypothetical protein
MKHSRLFLLLTLGTLGFGLFFMQTYNATVSASSIPPYALFGKELPQSFGRVTTFQGTGGILGQMILERENTKIIIGRISEELSRSELLSPFRVISNFPEFQKSIKLPSDSFLISFYESQIPLKKVSELEETSSSIGVYKALGARFRASRDEYYFITTVQTSQAIFLVLAMKIGMPVSQTIVENELAQVL